MEKEWQRAKKPDLVSRSLYKKGLHNSDNGMSSFNKCPAVKDNLNNLYELKSLYTYRFWITEKDIRSDNSNQEFSNEHLLLRDIDKKMFSFMQRYIFFTDSPSLEMSLYEFPQFENNTITESCILIPGKYDIGRWYRNTEFPFILKGNKFEINEGDVYSYIRFHTKEKIKFIQYRNNEKLNEYRQDGFYMNQYTKLKYMSSYYKNFKLKKSIISEIKRNLV